MKKTLKIVGLLTLVLCALALAGCGGGNSARRELKVYNAGDYIDPELVKTNTGRQLTDLTFDKVKSGDLSPLDFRISSETLELQAQVADADGRQTLARNLRRAAELVAVPDARLLEIYNALRPYRSTKAELYEIADELEGQYGAKVSAGFVREAADVYEARGRLRED